MIASLTSLQAQVGNQATARVAATVMRDGGRATLAERQQHLRDLRLVRQLAGLGLGVSEREAHRYLRLVAVRPLADITTVATGRPAHRSVYDMVQLCLGLPGTGAADIVALAGAAVIGVPALIALANGVAGARTGAELAELATRLPAVTVAQLTTLALLPGRPVGHLVRLANRVPPHRSLGDAADLAAGLPAIGIPNLVLLLAMPAQRSVAHLVRLITQKPAHRSIAFMIQLATAHALSVANLQALASLPAARDPELGMLVSQRPRAVSIAAVAALAAALPARPGTDIIALARLLQRGVAQPAIVQIGQAAAHRDGDDLVQLRTALPALPATDLVTLANIVPAAGLDAPALISLAGALNPRSAADLALLADQLAPAGLAVYQLISLGMLPRLTGAELVGLMQNRPVAATAGAMITFLEEIDPHNLTAPQTGEAAAIEWAVQGRLPNPRLFLTGILGFPALRGALGNVATVVTTCSHLAPANLVTAMTRSPGNLANMVTHAADLDAAGVMLGTQPLCNQMLAQDALIAAGDDVRTILTAAPHLRVGTLLTAMTRSPANLANLVTHAADLDATAVLLTTALLRDQMLAQDALIAAGDDVHTVILGGPHLRVAALLTAMTRAAGNLAHLVNNVADLEAAAVALNDAAAVADMLGSDHCLANGARVRATVAALTHVPAAAVAGAMAASLVDLNLLHLRRIAIDRALTGQNGITATRLLNVLDHIQGNQALPGGPAQLDPQLRQAQSLGSQLRRVLATRLGQPANAVYLQNLIAAVDTLDGVTWASRGGRFNSGNGGVDFGANVWVPSMVDGFYLTNHAIGHLVYPRDNHHRVRISSIKRALGNYAGTVSDFQGWRDWYQGDGLRLITPQDDATVITIFFT